MKGIVNQFVIDRSVYVAPHCSVVEMYSEGMLCLSGLNGNINHDGVFGDDEPMI